jgi:hypothetical protein
MTAVAGARLGVCENELTIASRKVEELASRQPA